MIRLKRYVPAFALLALTAFAGFMRLGTSKPMDAEAFNALYDTPAPAPSTPQNVFHLGHSLVGPDMPLMVKQLAGNEHNFSSQLGWGTPLMAHWEPDETINGFEIRNMPSGHQDAREAIATGDYDTLVLTEMVEIRDAIKYFDSAKYLHEWVQLGRQSNPEMRIYLYETWHMLDGAEDWLERLDNDLERYWETEILRRAATYEDKPEPVYIIPAGQVMAQFVREVENRGGIGPISNRSDLFSDNIHLSDYGLYLVALTHYAVLYQTSPVGLPHKLAKADGTIADDLGSEAAQLMQETVWDVVQKNTRTGVASD
ncbi:hypothetical protein SAMN05444358_102144 [Ruegeria halocynthiae]|uniref:SGNH/GDSL hydrolase family protein n=1 Tax=Ruegeria halocynthiae TaxID=985054 RepID=A0A1H2Y2T1_9RHOB|nr:hypothetical protein [Ruegeria halocynthiae]SDW99482.1 hypothetical protein SAMN05444358_102144 [Ruegeria halocynthiae]